MLAWSINPIHDIREIFRSILRAKGQTRWQELAASRNERQDPLRPLGVLYLIEPGDGI